MMFSTYDRENDLWTRDNDPLPSNSGSASKYNCAVFNGGGFWYKNCGYCSVNTVRGRGSYFQWNAAPLGTRFLQSTRMWLTC